MNAPPSIINFTDNIIKYSDTCIVFYDNYNVYKQFIFNKFKWIHEFINVKMLNHVNIIKYKKYEIIRDYIIKRVNNKIYIGNIEKVFRITMDKYDLTLDMLDIFSDDDVINVFSSILIANIYCNKMGVLHRDIKEKNIFINYENADNKIIKNVVLADFNISKYRYDISELNKCNIITKTHRPPEISYAIIHNKKIKYDERVDVWSLCIVLSYLITGKKFYIYLYNNYLLKDEFIIYDTDQLKIILTKFIDTYENKNLSYLNFYKNLIFKGIAKYDSRSSFNDIYLYMLKYTNIYNINVYIPKIDIEVNQNKLNIYKQFNDILILNIHNDLNNNSGVLDIFYKMFNIIEINYANFNNDNKLKISLYFLSNLIIIDKNILVDDYLSIVNKYNNITASQLIKNIKTIINVLKCIDLI